MKIKLETIQYFKNKGVSVRWYPERDFEAFRKRMWQKEYEFCFNYSKSSCKELNPGQPDWTYNFQTLEEFELKCKGFADNYVGRACDSYNFDKLFIEYDGKTIIKKESVKSKELTIEYVQKLIDKNEKAYKGYYGEFALSMQKLLKENGIEDKFSIYPTTYGIGVWVFYNWSAKDDIEKVTKILNERGVEYYNEYSEAHWVYRYKVSKSAENINKIIKY